MTTSFDHCWRFQLHGLLRFRGTPAPPGDTLETLLVDLNRQVNLAKTHCVDAGVAPREAGTLFIALVTKSVAPAISVTVTPPGAAAWLFVAGRPEPVILAPPKLSEPPPVLSDDPDESTLHGYQLVWWSHEPGAARLLWRQRGQDRDVICDRDANGVMSWRAGPQPTPEEADAAERVFAKHAPPPLNNARAEAIRVLRAFIIERDSGGVRTLHYTAPRSTPGGTGVSCPITVRFTPAATRAQGRYAILSLSTPSEAEWVAIYKLFGDPPPQPAAAPELPVPGGKTCTFETAALAGLQRETVMLLAGTGVEERLNALRIAIDLVARRIPADPVTRTDLNYAMRDLHRAFAPFAPFERDAADRADRYTEIISK